MNDSAVLQPTDEFSESNRCEGAVSEGQGGVNIKKTRDSSQTNVAN